LHFNFLFFLLALDGLCDDFAFLSIIQSQTCWSDNSSINTLPTEHNKNT